MRHITASIAILAHFGFSVLFAPTDSGIMVHAKPKPDPLDVSNLAEEWDSTESIRTRLRSGLGLLHEESGKGEDVYIYI